METAKNNSHKQKPTASNRDQNNTKLKNINEAIMQSKMMLQQLSVVSKTMNPCFNVYVECFNLKNAFNAIENKQTYMSLSYT